MTKKSTSVIYALGCGSIHLDTAIQLRTKENSTFRVKKQIEALQEDLELALQALNLELESDEYKKIKQ